MDDEPPPHTKITGLPVDRLQNGSGGKAESPPGDGVPTIMDSLSRLEDFVEACRENDVTDIKAILYKDKDYKADDINKRGRILKRVPYSIEYKGYDNGEPSVILRPTEPFTFVPYFKKDPGHRTIMPDKPDFLQGISILDKGGSLHLHIKKDDPENHPETKMYRKFEQIANYFSSKGFNAEFQKKEGGKLSGILYVPAGLNQEVSQPTNSLLLP